MKLHDNVTGFQHMGFPTNDLAETVASTWHFVPTMKKQAKKLHFCR